MNSEFLQIIYNKVVAPALGKIPKEVRATVIEFYPKQKRCKVRFADPNSRNVIEQIVPVQISGGINHPGPFPGEEVQVRFPAGNYTQGYICGVLDLNYSSSTRNRNQNHFRQGSWMPDSIGSRTGEL